MALNKEETYSLLSDLVDNADVVIPAILSKLGFDDTTQEYPEDVVEKAEEVAKELNLAMKSNRKQLTAASECDTSNNEESKPSEIILREVSEVAVSNLRTRGIDGISMESMFSIIQAAVTKDAAMAEMINEARFQVVDKVIKSGDARITTALIDSMRGTQQAVSNLLDNGTISKIVNATVPDEAPFDVSAFLTEMKLDKEKKEQGKLQQQTQREEQVANKKQKELNNVDDFLKAMGVA